MSTSRRAILKGDFARGIAMILLAFVAICGGAQPLPKKDAQQFARAAKARILEQLKDPGSAQFRRVFIARHDNGELTLCGEVNAKNGYGGYDGFRPFISSLGAMVYMGDQIDALLLEYCGKKVADAPPG